MDIIQAIDWSPLFISLKTGVAATFFAFFLGIVAAGFVMKLRNGMK